MAIKGNDSTQEVVKGGGRYTGLANVTVLSVNPTLEEIKKTNPQANKEVEYLTDGSDVEKGNKPAQHFKKHMLRFGVHHLASRTFAPLTFWLESRPRWNQAGDKVEWINKYGNTAWSANEETPPAYDWFKLDGVRPALNGEKPLTDFIKAWANVGEEDQGCLDNPLAIANGDLTELKGLIAALPKNTVTVLFGVNKVEKDGKTNYYQNVYNTFFTRASDKGAAAKWVTQMNGEYGQWKNVDWQNDLTFKPYVPKLDNRATPTNLDLPNSSAQDVTGEPRFSF